MARGGNDAGPPEARRAHRGRHPPHHRPWAEAMYDLIETGHGTPRTTSYPTLHEATDGLTDRAAAFMRTPGATILTQRPRQFAATGRDGERITLHLRKRAPRHASGSDGRYVPHLR